STVDSGNLAGHLVALRQALLATPEQPVVDGRVARALTARLSLAADQGGKDPAIAELVRGARAVLGAAAPLPPPEALLARGTALRRDGSRLERPGGDWVDWCRLLAERHAEWTGSLSFRAGRGRELEAALVSESWHEVAARVRAAP